MNRLQDHRKIWAAGFFAGAKDSLNALEATWETSGLPAAQAMLCWNPGTDQVAVVDWPDEQGKSRPYLMTGLACYVFSRPPTHEQWRQKVFMEAVHLIVRDKCDPMAVHRALLRINEYRSGLSDDMPRCGR